MGRFSEQLAQRVGKVEAALREAEKKKEKVYLVDNSVLLTKSKGIKYRFSPDINAVDSLPLPPRLSIQNPRSREIKDGTRVIVLANETRVFIGTGHSQTIQCLKEGQELTAAGQPEHIDGYDMLPIRASNLVPYGGAVQLRCVELEKEYFTSYSQRTAEFGTLVRGVPHSDAWVKVGSLYLPTHVDNAPVLVHAWWEEVEEEEQPEATATGHPNWTTLEILEKMSNKIDGEGAPGREKKLHQGPSQVKIQRPCRDDNEDDIDPFDVSFLSPGCGSQYEVIADKAIIRRKPLMMAKLDNIKYKGARVELFEWDETMKWRRCYDEALPLTGWMLLDKPEVGPLLRPLYFPNKAWASTPFTPMMAAVFENDAAQLQKLLSQGQDAKFRFERGPSLIKLAKELGHMNCYVYLMAKGAKCEAGSPIGLKTKESMEPRLQTALIRALSGHSDFAMLDYDRALELLEADAQAAAESLFDAVADQLANESRVTQVCTCGAKFKGKAKFCSECGRSRPEEAQVQELPSYREFNIGEEGSDAESEAEGDGEEEEEPIEGAAEENANSDGVEELYQVLQDVRVRQEPTQAGVVVGHRKAGQFIKLYEYDATMSWRRCKTGGAEADKKSKEPTGSGWIRLSHDKLGELVTRVADEDV